MLPLSIFDSLAAVAPLGAECMRSSAEWIACPLLLRRLPLSGTRDPFHALGEPKDSRQESKG
jgi:hypothetical protein